MDSIATRVDAVGNEVFVLQRGFRSAHLGMTKL
jgi:hypothetical protein